MEQKTNKPATKATRRTRIGRVVAANTSQTVAVQVEDIRQHPKFKKYLKHFTKFQVHDPQSVCELGDTVRIEECRPVSKNKTWVVREVIKKARPGAAEPVATGEESAS